MAVATAAAIWEAGRSRRVTAPGRATKDSHELDRDVQPAPLRSTRAGLLGHRRGPLPTPGDALLVGDAPGALQARLPGVHPELRDADRRARVRLHRRLLLQAGRPGPGERDTRALRARGGGLRAEVLARAAARVGRDVQAGLDQGPPGAAVGRSRRAVR